jgi:Domain of unknown function (DUF4032)
MSNMEPLGAQEQLDFNSARTKAFLRAIFGVISGHRNQLMAWDEVKDKLGLRGLIARGMQTVPIDKIVGSVGRYHDFDNVFLPRNNSLSSRWRSIDRAFYDDVNLPPIKLYKVGQVYFVLDGNHRVSVAREHGSAYIDAEVSEAITRVGPTTLADLNADSLTILGEYAGFLERTQLDKLRPGQNVRFSIGGGYERLIEHIAVHRYFMGLDLKRDISEDEAVMDWYDNVYMPIVKAVREESILRHFPGRTETDLYLWIIDHKHFLNESCGRDITPEDAAADYAKNYAPRPPFRRMQDAVGQLVQTLTDKVTPAGDQHS